MSETFQSGFYQITASERLEYTPNGKWYLSETVPILGSWSVGHEIPDKYGILMYYLFRRVEIAERSLRLAFEMNQVYEGGRDLVRLLAEKNLNTMRELVDYVDDVVVENKKLIDQLQEYYDRESRHSDR